MIAFCGVALAGVLACGSHEGSPGVESAPGDRPRSQLSVWTTGSEPTAVVVANFSVYVAHAGSEAGDGWIGSYGPDGNLVDTLAAGIPAPADLAVARDVLHVAHYGGLTSYRLPDGEVVGRAAAPANAGGYTAVTSAPEGTVFVANHRLGRVWRLDPGAGTAAAVPIATLPAVAGIAFDESSDRLYLASGTRAGQRGRLWVLDGDATAVERLGNVEADFTSLVLRGGRLYCSTMNPTTSVGNVLAVTTDGASVDAVPGFTDLVTPGKADLLGGELFFVPEYGRDRVIVTRLRTPEQ